MKYKLTFITGIHGGAGTDAKVSIRLIGTKKETTTITLSSRLNQFEQGDVDHFFVETDKIGDLREIEIWHNNSLLGANWFLNEVIVNSAKPEKTWYFPFHKWIKENNRYRIKAVKHSHYAVEVTTGTLPGSGSKNQIQIAIIGTKSYTPFLDLKNGTDRKELKTGHTDYYSFLAEDVGNIKEIKIQSLVAKFGSDWFLNRIKVKKVGYKNYINFPFHNWIKSDNIYSSSRDLIEYVVKFYTGDVAYGGTDANVFMKLYGSKETTEPIRLNELISRNAFEAGNIDYIKYAHTDIGNIEKIKIWHDEKWPADGWFLNKIIIKNDKSGGEFKFPYYSWLDKSADPKSTKIELTGGSVSSRPFYAIAHMVNTPAYAEEAMDLGSNAIEFDITPKYNGNNRFSFDVFHGFRPDFDPDKINLMERSLARTDLTDFLISLKLLEKKYSNFALAIYDCKVDNIKKSLLFECGKQLGDLAMRYFYGFNNTQRIFTIFSIAKKRSAPFLDGLTESVPDKFKHLVGFDFSMEKFQSAERVFANKAGNNFWWGGGIASTVPKPLKHFIPQFLIAASKRTKRGIIKKIYYWTLDDPDSMARMLVTKLDGIIVNDPLKLLRVLEKEEFRHTYKLAKRNDNPFTVV